jgi:hypothetical protein
MLKSEKLDYHQSPVIIRNCKISRSFNLSFAISLRNFGEVFNGYEISRRFIFSPEIRETSTKFRRNFVPTLKGRDLKMCSLLQTGRAGISSASTDQTNVTATLSRPALSIRFVFSIKFKSFAYFMYLFAHYR